MAAALVALAACGDDGGAAAQTTTTTSSTTTTTEATTTTTEPVDPTTVPDEITEPYVQAVLDELYAIEGDAIRLAVEEGLVTGEVLELLSTIYGESEQREVANLLLDAATFEFEGVRRPPGDPEAEVLSLVSASSECVFAETSFDVSQVTVVESEPIVTFVELRRSDSNRTPWRIEFAPAVPEGSDPPEDPCVD